jgi:hypothetical protein
MLEALRMLSQFKTNSKHGIVKRPFWAATLSSMGGLLLPVAAHAGIGDPNTGAVATVRGEQSESAAPTNTVPVAANDPEQAPRHYRLSLRPSLGFGGGNAGPSARFGAAGEYWLNEHLGVGLQAAMFGVVDSVLGPSQSAEVIVPALTLRSTDASDYAIATLGVGYGYVDHGNPCPLVLFYAAGDEQCTASRLRYGGYAVSASLGYVGHPGRSSFELGPVVRFDTVGGFSRGESPDYLVTLNLEFGFALRR